MIVRTILTLTICLATFAGSVMGLSNGMALVVHNDGHVGIEDAWLRHSHEHADGADHDAHDLARGSDHSDLHTALLADTDSCPPQPAQQQKTKDVKPSLELPAQLAAANPALEHAQVPTARDARESRGITARLENTRLRTVVLVI
jgi:hypothetical protein